MLRPSIENIDLRVSETRKAQEELKLRIEDLTKDLEEIESARDPRKDVDLEGAINKLNNAKKRVVVIANILQGAQVRSICLLITTIQAYLQQKQKPVI